MLTSSAHTLKSYRDSLALYIAFLESKGTTPSDLARSCFERDMIEEWVRWLKTVRGNGPDTCNVRLASLRTFLEYVGTRDVSLMYLHQEAKLVKRQKCPKKKVCGLTRAAVAAMLAAPDTTTAAGRRDLAFMVLLYATAARLGEILSMRVGQVHVEGESRPYAIIAGKGGKTRTMYLLPRAVAHLRRYIAEAHGPSPDPEACLFYSRVGGKRAKLTEPAMDKRLKKHAVVAHEKCPDVPLGIHAHQFRHAKASHWIEDGVNVLQVSFLLGHANLETTMVYIDVTKEEKAKALATLEGEDETRVAKKWKSLDGTLGAFCGLAK